jgi:hypothetical protein
MTFGRPTMITNLSTLVVPESMAFDVHSVESTAQTKLQFQNESVRLSIILDSMLSKVYKPWQCRVPDDGQSLISHMDTACQSMDIFVELHRRLQTFELSVPSSLSWNKPLTMESILPEDAKILAIQRNVLHAR